jgi:hypothetical protein
LAVRHGKVVEVLVSFITITSVMMLLAGNLVGMGFVNSYVRGTSQTLGTWVSAYIVWSYTVGGGFSRLHTLTSCKALSDGTSFSWMQFWPLLNFLPHVYQTESFFRSGCLVCAYWLIVNEGTASPPSIGFPGYIYPNQDICDLYNGIPCTYDPSHCCYNETKWCEVDSVTGNFTNCKTDNGAYPIGDQLVYPSQMASADALLPFPNPI